MRKNIIAVVTAPNGFVWIFTRQSPDWIVKKVVTQ